MKSSLWPEDLPFYRSPDYLLPHFTPAMQTSLFFTHTKHTQVHLGAVDLLFPLPGIFHVAGFFTAFDSFFSISSLKNRLPNTSYLKKVLLVILNSLILPWFSSRLLSTSEAVLVYMVAL